MAVLVTGAAGFIGSHVAEALQKEGHEVIGIDDLSGGFRGNVPAHIQFVEGSILDVSLVERIFRAHQIEQVYHLAAYAAEGLSHFIRRFNYTNNVVGSMVLINEAVKAGVKCFVFTSSIAVYGPAQTPMRETTVPTPEDPYGIGKYAVELDLHAAQRMFGLPFVIFRPHNVYGERQNIGDRYRNVIGIFMNQLMRGEALTIFGDGTQTRAFSYIGDVAPVIAKAGFNASAINETFNIGADTATSLNELAAEVARAMGKTAQIRYLPGRLEVAHASADHSKLSRIFGNTPKWSLAEGLKRMAAWALATGAMDPSVFEQIEVRRNLPKSWNI